MHLENNTILITGGTSGFGFEFASKLIALGNTVIITGRNAQKLQETKQKLPAVHIIQSDV
ncbi:SDR family NAD(P)-dependent oxidoreductase [Haliscomenobacter sp.]|uniref:SDR family NAD(P)-dependent oxidoreductase n=1 Tax=Haliscomenobacter sp. TaxID=2717303 RepID=UPI003BABD1A3